MATAPYGIRLLVGAAAIAVEETRKLPQTILMYPMTLVSQAAHVVMRMQQNLAELLNKGDSTLEAIFPPKDEQAEWATFDEDFDDALTNVTPRATEGRFALYSNPEPESVDSEAPPTPVTKPAKKAAATKATAANAAEPASATGIVAELGYEALTLAQLRARLQSLTVADLETLLAHEESTKARAPFQTLLANRITRATAK